MQFEWDDAKAAFNRAKHGVSFELAKRVWDDPFYEEVLDRVVDGQERWHAIGWVAPFCCWLSTSSQTPKTRND